MRRFFILLLCLLAQPIWANLTNVQYTTFVGNGVTPINSGNPQNLGTITGNFFPLPVGPSATNGQQGWSSVIAGTSAVGTPAWHNIAISSSTGQATNGMLGAWFYINTISDYSTAAGYARMLAAGDNASPDTFDVVVNYTNWLQGITYGSLNQVLCPAPTMQWFYLAIAWNITNSTTKWGAYWIYTNNNTPSGAWTWSQLGTNAALTGTQSKMNQAEGGCKANLSPAAWSGRYGMPQLFAMNLSSDAAYPTNLPNTPTIYPPTNGISSMWYVSAATGSDSTGSGLVNAPWATMTNMSFEINQGGVFWTTNTWLTGTLLTNVTTNLWLGLYTTYLTNIFYTWVTNTAGDEIIVDNTSPMIFPSNGIGSLSINASGLRLQFTNGPIQVVSNIPSASWSKVGATSYTYAMSNAVPATGLTNSTLWEDWRWMYNGLFATYALSSNYLDATSGSWFNDGTNIFVHTFENGNPGSDGHVYQASLWRGAYTGSLLNSTPIIVYGSNVWVDGLIAQGTAMVTPTGGEDGIGVITFQGAGTNMLSNSKISYCSDHAVITTLQANTTNACSIYSNVDVEQMSIYPLGLSGPAFTDYAASACSNNSYIYYNCTFNQVIGLQGSTNGLSGLTPGLAAVGGFWLSHNSSGGPDFNYGYFSNCVSTGSGTESGVNSGWLYVINSSLYNFTTECGMVCAGSTALNGLLGIVATSPACQGTGVFMNNIFQVNTNVASSALQWQYIAGTNLYVHNSIDTRAFTGPGTGSSIFIRAVSGAMPNNLTFLCNDAILGTAGLVRLFGSFTNTDTILSTGNVWEAKASSLVVSDYYPGNAASEENLTFAQWQSLGFDAGSLAPSAGCRLNPLNEYPYSDSVCRLMDTNAGPAVDYTGFLAASRRTAGAMEWRTKGTFGGFQ